MTSLATSICPGTLRHKIIFFNPKSDTTSDGRGGIVGGAGADLLTQFASIDPETRDEVFGDEQMKGVRNFRIVTPWTSELAALGDLTRLRIKFGTRKFRIVAFVNRDERDAIAEIRAAEIRTDG